METITRVGGEQLIGRDVGPYRVEGTLSGGGSGAWVFLARHRELDRPAALKVVELAKLDAAAQARFRRELKAAARVEHPGVARAFASGEEDGLLWLASEHVPGESLAELLARGTLEPLRALSIASGLARALAAIHAAGLVHRDLKPGNVVLRDDGSPVVVDFGLAQVPDSTALTRVGTLLGTPLYAAPEQLAIAGTVDPRADLFALGCILYEALAGRVPHDTGDRDLRAFLVRRAEASLDPLPARADLPAGIAPLLRRMLAREPAERPDAATAARELDALRRTLAPSPAPATAHAADPDAATLAIPATPPAPRARASSLPSPLALASGGAAGLLVVVLLVAAFAGSDPPPLAPPPPATLLSPAPTPPSSSSLPLPLPHSSSLRDALQALESLDFDRATTLLEGCPAPPGELAAARALTRVLRQLNGDDPLPEGKERVFEDLSTTAPETWALVKRLQPELTAHAWSRYMAEQRNMLGLSQVFARSGPLGTPRHLVSARRSELELLQRVADASRTAFLRPAAGASEMARIRESELGRTSLGRRLDPWLGELQRRWENRGNR